MSIPDDLMARAMSLPEEDRLALGQQLVESVPAAPDNRDPDWEESWATELKRREALIESGEAEWLSAEELMKRVREGRARRLGRHPC